MKDPQDESLGGHHPQSWWRKRMKGKESCEKDQVGVEWKPMWKVFQEKTLQMFHEKNQS